MEKDKFRTKLENNKKHKIKAFSIQQEKNTIIYQ